MGGAPNPALYVMSNPVMLVSQTVFSNCTGSRELQMPSISTEGLPTQLVDKDVTFMFALCLEVRVIKVTNSLPDNLCSLNINYFQHISLYPLLTHSITKFRTLAVLYHYIQPFARTDSYLNSFIPGTISD